MIAPSVSSVMVSLLKRVISAFSQMSFFTILSHTDFNPCLSYTDFKRALEVDWFSALRPHSCFRYDWKAAMVFFVSAQAGPIKRHSNGTEVHLNAVSAETDIVSIFSCTSFGDTSTAAWRPENVLPRI